MCDRGGRHPQPPRGHNPIAQFISKPPPPAQGHHPIPVLNFGLPSVRPPNIGIPHIGLGFGFGQGHGPGPGRGPGPGHGPGPGFGPWPGHGPGPGQGEHYGGGGCNLPGGRLPTESESRGFTIDVTIPPLPNIIPNFGWGKRPASLDLVWTGQRTYLITSFSSGLAFTVEGTGITTRSKTYESNQLWYDHPETGTIRSKLNSLALTITVSGASVSAFQQGNGSQQWIRAGNHILNRLDRKKCIDVKGGSKNGGATIISFDFHGTYNQLWNYEILSESKTTTSIAIYRRYYVISNNLNGFALTVAGGNLKPGTAVIIRPTTFDDSQLWYDHLQTGTIRSKLTDFCLDVERGVFVVNPFEAGDLKQVWLRFGNNILNRFNILECLNVKDKSDGAAVSIEKFKGTDTQSWSFFFVTGKPSKDSPPAVDYQYYVIRSKSNGLVLSVDGSGDQSGASVVLQEYRWTDGQLWYDDADTGTIRNKLNGFCLVIANGALVVSYYDQEDRNQQWIRYDDRVFSFLNPQEGLEVKDTYVIIGKFSNATYQQWTFEFVSDAPPPPPEDTKPPPVVEEEPPPPPPPPPPPREEFYIVSGMHGKVVEVKDGSTAAGAELVVNPKKSGRDKSQLFYLDDNGFIRSALSELAFTSTSPNPIKLNPASDEASAQWRFDGSKVVSANGNVLDICGGSPADGAQLIAFEPRDQANQVWNREA